MGELRRWWAASIGRVTPAFALVVALNLILVIQAAMLYLRWQEQAAHETAQALQNGQRVMIQVVDGKITGHIHRSAPETQEAPPAAPIKAPQAAAPLLTETIYHPKYDPVPADRSTKGETEAKGPSVLKLLNEAPIPELQQDSPLGKLPVMSAEGTTAWRQYGRGLVADAAMPRMSVVLYGVGLSQRTTAAVLEKLPPDISISFSPYTQDIATWANFARARGHELWVDLPLEPRDYPVSDPGPFGLNRREPEEENLRRLHWAMSKVPAAVGFVASADENFFGQPLSGQPVVQDIAMRGLLLAYANPRAGASFGNVKLPAYAPNWQPQRIHHTLGYNPSPEEIEGFFRALEAQAREKGSAVGMIPAIPLVIENLQQWLAALPSKQMVLAPLTAQITSPYVAKTRESAPSSKAATEQPEGAKEKTHATNH